MKYLFFKILVLFIFISTSYALISQENSEQENVNFVESHDLQKRSIRLNNYPISIFTPQTQQFVQGINVTAINGVTGATGPSEPCLLSLAMMRRTLSGFVSADIFSGDTGTFDTGLLYNIVSNPTGSPSSTTPTQSLTIQNGGYYLLEFSYAGDQITTDPTSTTFYARFNILVNNAIAETFTLSTLGVRQIWQYIIFLSEGDIIAVQAASNIPFLIPPAGVSKIDCLIWTLNWIGPCTAPS
ncbi:hypothetical protein HYV10_03450 [Candidatus Dependentiae bacterium]|nr:hypothetical protein [Candidatus Dependentiae bacterium]